MSEKVEIIKSDGEKLSVDLINEFDLVINEETRRFVLLTANEIDQNGLIKILASEIKDGKLVRIESDDDWTAVKNVMRSIISSSKGDFTYVAPSSNMSFEVSDDYARVIAVQDVAKQALVTDFSENKPQEEQTPQEEAKAEDPNSAIYPSENEAVPIGSEVVPGIAETTDSEETSEEAAPQEEAKEETNDEPAIPEIPAIPTPEENNPSEEDAEAPAVNTQQPVKVETTENNSARDILIKEITDAVDKYIASQNGNQDIQLTIAKMQEDLAKMQESLKA